MNIYYGPGTVLSLWTAANSFNPQYSLSSHFTEGTATQILLKHVHSSLLDSVGARNVLQILSQYVLSLDLVKMGSDQDIFIEHESKCHGW